jgi:hypothetical protein
MPTTYPATYYIYYNPELFINSSIIWKIAFLTDFGIEYGFVPEFYQQPTCLADYDQMKRM